MKLKSLLLILVAGIFLNTSLQAQNFPSKFQSKSFPSIEKAKQVKPPFVGKRYFETEPGGAGSGTPAYYVIIKPNRDVYFGYLQVNQADGTEKKEQIYAGKFKEVMKVSFKIFKNTFIFRIKGNYIYELDGKGNVKKGDGCCEDQTNPNPDCECRSELRKGN